MAQRLKKKSNIFNHILPISLVLITLAIGLFVFAKQPDSHTSDNAGTEVTSTSDEGVTVIRTVHLTKLSGGIATFEEDIPDYVYGRVSDNSVDTTYFKGSDFRVGSTYKLTRTTEDSAGGSYDFKYSFSRVEGDRGNH